MPIDAGSTTIQGDFVALVEADVTKKDRKRRPYN
jgi:hypothetical protein